MKTILALFFICLAHQLHAQSTVLYDYHSGEYKPDMNCVPQSSTIRYQIININTFAQKAVMNGELISLTTDMPAELATLFRIKVDDAEKNLDDVQEQVAEMKLVAEKAATTVKEATVAASANKSAKKAIVAVVSETIKVQAIETKKLVDSCNIYYQEAQKIKAVLVFQKELAATMADGTYYNELLMERTLNSRGINAAAIDILKTDFVKLTDAYNKVYSQYERAARAARDADDKDNEDKINEAEEQVEKDHEAIRKQYEETLMSIKELFAKALNPANYITTSRSINVKEGTDEVKFQIKVGGLKDDLSKAEPLDKIIKVQGGLKIDFSVGLVAKFIADDQYFFDSDTTLQQRDKSTFLNTITPGIASMMHFYRRTCNDVAFGGMFGINADFKELTDVNLGFLTGASVILGRSQKVILSTGLSYSKVSRLKDGEYVTGKVYKNTKIETITERVLRPSWFVSISLNLAQRKVLAIQ